MKHTRDDSLGLYVHLFVHVCKREYACVDVCVLWFQWMDASVAYLYVHALVNDSGPLDGWIDHRWHNSMTTTGEGY